MRAANRFSGIWSHCVLAAATVGVLSICAQTARAGSAEAWGVNSNGQLGNGTTVGSNAPVAVNGMSSGVTAVAAGSAFSLAVQNGAALAWGENQAGQLGDNTMTNSDSPVGVSGLSSGVTAVAGGYTHSLAIQGGAALAWGDNTNGELGNNSTNQSSIPVAVSGLSSNVTAIAAGNQFSFAIHNGAALSWGIDGGTGQLGDSGAVYSSDVPVSITGLTSNVTAIAAGENHGLAVQGGAAMAWGSNAYGQLGDNTTTNRNSPVAVTGLGSNVTTVAAGRFFSLAVQNGNVWAWGDDDTGQLGDNSTNNQDNPEEIDPTDLTDIVAVAAGYNSSYALASDGSIWDWGNNADGELGLSSNTADYLTPQHLLPPVGYRFTSIDSDSAGFHAIATLSAVPEPASISLLLLGGLPLLSRRRSERRRLNCGRRC